mgnify:FL=1
MTDTDVNRTAILFLSHLSDRVTLNRFQTLSEQSPAEYDTYWIHDSDHGDLPQTVKAKESYSFGIDDANTLGHPHKYTNFISGNAHIPIILFAFDHSEYNRFWVIEYDVSFTGCWSTFFRRTEVDPSDLLTSSIRRVEDQPAWPHWKTFQHPSRSTSDFRLLASFNPIYRISRQALEHIHKSQISGWKGDYEVLMPTLLHHEGIPISDFSKSSEFASKEIGDALCIRDVTHRYRPPMYNTGRRPEMIYHPVKPPYWFYLSTKDRFRDHLNRLVRKLKPVN